MKTDAIVNTANEYPEVGPGCDRAVYEAAGYDELLAYRKEHIGFVKQGEAFLTPGFNLPAKYIIHAVRASEVLLQEEPDTGEGKRNSIYCFSSDLHRKLRISQGRRDEDRGG